jgi:DnaJ-domain-containing protein 1
LTVQKEVSFVTNQSPIALSSAVSATCPHGQEDEASAVDSRVIICGARSMKFKAIILILLASCSWSIFGAEEEPDPRLLDTSSYGSAQFCQAWKDKYPQLGAYFGNLSGFVTGFAMRDQEIKSGTMTGPRLAEHISSLNRDFARFDQILKEHPELKRPPELAVVKRRISFEAFSEASLSHFVKMADNAKRGDGASLYLFQNPGREKFRELMMDDYFTKKEDLKRVKADTDNWLANKEIADDLAKKITLLQLDLDELNEQDFKNKRARIKTMIEELRGFITEKSLEKNDSEGVKRQIEAFKSLDARFQTTSSTLESSLLEKEKKQAAIQAQQAQELAKTRIENSGSRPEDPARGNAGPERVNREQDNSTIILGVLGGMLLILLVSIYLHSQKQLVFFGDYTDAAMTFAGPLVSFLSAFILGALDSGNHMETIVPWSLAFIFASYGFKWSVAYNRNPAMAMLSFMSKYFLSVSYLVVMLGFLAGGSSRRKGESEEDYARRREREERQRKATAAILTALTAFLVRYLVKERRFSSLSSYFAFEWPSRSEEQSHRGANYGDEADGEPRKGRRASKQSQKKQRQNASSGEFTTEGEPLDASQILGVSRDATEEEIRDAYRQQMREYHPDKVAHLGKELRELAERKAKEINIAYEELLQRAKSAGMN